MPIFAPTYGQYTQTPAPLEPACSLSAPGIYGLNPSGCPVHPEGHALMPSGQITDVWPLWSVLILASTAASAYHGYKRNHSVGWAAVWGVSASLLPVIVPAIAVAQGFGKPEHK